MSDQLQQVLDRLKLRHAQRLRWFQDSRGSVVGWGVLSDPDERRATAAKGIYKPRGKHFALSVKRILGSEYRDPDPVTRDDGTFWWVYHREGSDDQRRYTNAGLLACLDDDVPVGVIDQVSVGPEATYVILGLATPVEFDGTWFQLEGFSQDGLRRDGLRLSEAIRMAGIVASERGA